MIGGCRSLLFDLDGLMVDSEPGARMRVIAVPEGDSERFVALAEAVGEDLHAACAQLAL